MKRPFAEALAFGDWGVERVIEQLTPRRWYIERTDQLPPENGHGPRMHSEHGALVPGDLRIAKMGHTLSIEVRTKSSATMGRLTQELEHGIGWDSWENLRAYDRNIDPMWLVIVEHNTGSILGRRINLLKLRADCPTYVRGERMAYFTRSQLHADWLDALDRHVGRRDWPRANKARSTQGDLFP